MTLNVFDVAEYVLQRLGPTSTIKLQKLVYYCQAWSLAWDDVPLFDDDFEAWANGPVVPRLYNAHRGFYEVRPGEMGGGDPGRLNTTQRETVDLVLAYYGDKGSQWLSDLTHNEDPWKSAREGVPEGERSNRVISKESMLEYYSSLQ
jgi:uncharacterized phage-associated protein